MSDHCHMSVKCRREDRARFEALGFQIAWGEKENTPVIEMIDEEANYAHYNDMPANIPYYGTWAAGDNYGPGRLVCDGKNYETVAANDDGFVIAWHYRFGLPTLKSILEIRRYLKIEKRCKSCSRHWSQNYRPSTSSAQIPAPASNAASQLTMMPWKTPVVSNESHHRPPR
jgi:hypothetical protein